MIKRRRGLETERWARLHQTPTLLFSAERESLLDPALEIQALGAKKWKKGGSWREGINFKWAGISVFGSPIVDCFEPSRT